MINKPYFSIVIPTLNEEKFLPSLLQDLTKQTFFSDKFEVIVIDSDSEDETINKTSKFAKILNLKTYLVSKRNVSFQRNYGAEKAKGEWILFFDADTRIPKDFIKKISEEITNRPNCDVFTTFLAQNSRSWQEKVSTFFINLGFKIYLILGQPVAMGAFIASKKNVLTKISFSQKHRYLEDTFFIRHAKSLGFKFCIFTKSKYFFSFRRMKSQGFFSFMMMHILLQFRFIIGNEFLKKVRAYPMKGGNYYEK